MKVKRCALVVLMVLLALSLFAGGGGQKASTAGGQKVIGFAQASMESAFLIPVYDYARREAEKLGVKLLMMDAQWDAATQTSQIENMIMQKVDALIIIPVDEASQVPAIQKAHAAKIPIVNLNMRADSSVENLVASFVGPDIIKEAELAAELMVKALGRPSGKIAMITGSMGTYDAQVRKEYFLKWMAKNAPGIEVIAEGAGNWDRATSMSIAEDFLAKYNTSQLNGIYCHDDNMAVGAIEAAKATNRLNSLVVVGIGGSRDGYDAIKAGTQYGTVVQPPDWEGAQGVRAAVDLANGKKVEKWYQDPIEIVTKENVTNFVGLW
jgi:ABC-type sugar transport system substrate-binding protein